MPRYRATRSSNTWMMMARCATLGPGISTATSSRLWATSSRPKTSGGGGTLIAAVKLAELGPVGEPKHANKNVLEAVDAVAERLGNTRDIARASYISPRVIDHYLKGSVVAYHADHLEEVMAAEQGDLTYGERALLDLLNKELHRDLRNAA